MTDLVARLRLGTWNPEWAEYVSDLDMDEAADRIEQLEAENERLREALREISETPNAGWMIARAALGEKKP